MPFDERAVVDVSQPAQQGRACRVTQIDGYRHDADRETQALQAEVMARQNGHVDDHAAMRHAASDDEQRQRQRPRDRQDQPGRDGQQDIEKADAANRGLIIEPAGANLGGYAEDRNQARCPRDLVDVHAFVV